VVRRTLPAKSNRGPLRRISALVNCGWVVVVSVQCDHTASTGAAMACRYSANTSGLAPSAFNPGVGWPVSPVLISMSAEWEK
jgi:hypothetical protein